MKNTLSNKIIEPYFYSCDGIITDVNREFIDFTGFTLDELLGKSITEIWTMLKVNSQILLDNINSEYSVYIFTKSLYAREVNISLFYDRVANGQVYTFDENPNSRLDDKLIFMEQLVIDNNTTGYAVYSSPNLILLKSNQKYLDLIAPPLNNEGSSIGRPVKEIVSGFVGSESEVIWNSIHGGSIHVESDFGKGSKFTVKLPSRKVLQEGKLYISNLPIKNQNIQVELSDIY